MSLRQSLGYLRCAAGAGLLALGLSCASAVPASADNNSGNPCDSLLPPLPNLYRKAISDLTRHRHHDNLTRFIETFDEDKKTIILVHGGMGSELWQTRQRFDPKRVPAEYRFRTPEVWLNYRRLLAGALRQLKIEGDRDYKDKIIVADGPVTAPLVKPYNKALGCFRNEFGFNTYLLAWDARRDLMTAVEKLRSVIELIKTEKPDYDMREIFIVGHSMGGMVAKIFFETNQTLAKKIGGMISVGTPFYGFLGQLRWMFNGEPLLNNRGPIGNKYTPKEVAGIFASVPGFYTLLPIDAATYDETWNPCKKQSTRPSWCENWPDKYPVTDLGGKAADAYGNTHDYPDWVRGDERGPALTLRRCLARPLPESLNGRVFHIRVKGEDTPAAATWRRGLCPENQPDCDYDASQPLSPIPDKSIVNGPGDGTIPYWSAALTSTNKGHIIDLESGLHMTLLTENAVLGAIYKVVTETPPRSEGQPLTEEEISARCGADLPPMATRQELEDELERFDELQREALENDTPPPELSLSAPAQWRLLQELGR